MMKKIVIVALLASGLVACAQTQAPKEDSRLKEAYSACINTAEGSPEKIEACQSVLNVLKKEKAHEQFATQENSPASRTARALSLSSARSARSGRLQFSPANLPQY